MSELSQLRHEIVCHVIAELISAADDADKAPLASALADAAWHAETEGACPAAARTLRMVWRELPWSTAPGTSASLAVLVVQAANLCMDTLDGSDHQMVGDLVGCASMLRQMGVRDIRVALACSVSATATVADIEALLAAGRVVAAGDQASR